MGEGVIPGLVAALTDRDATVRASAAARRATSGPKRKMRPGRSGALLKDENAGLRSAADAALRKITAPKPQKP